MTAKKRGDIGEVIAIKYLQKNGYTICDTNFKFGRFWEVDIICQKDGQTIFIEVKYRSSESFGHPVEAVSRTKLHKCLKTVQYYCKKHSVSFEHISFDVIAIMKGS